MKQTFLVREHHPCLLIFFAGWGMDEQPFLKYKPKDCDFMLCYDYRDLLFDYSALRSYNSIRLIAWSMGVWAASQVMDGKHDLPFIDESIAVNGTNYPVDNCRGIPSAIFRLTLEGLTGANLQKFLRRICGSTSALKDFLAHTPQRPLEELREELRTVGDLAKELPPSSFVWDRAIIGSGDAIFMPVNQLKAFDSGTSVEQINCPHYSDALFTKLIEQGESIHE